MKKRFLTLVMVLAMLLALPACGKSNSASNTPSDSSASGSSTDSSNASGVTWEERTIRIAHDNGTDHHMHKALEMMKEKVAEATDGAVTLDLYPNSLLGGGNDIISQVMQGTLDAGAVSVASFAEYDSILEVVDVPYLKETLPECIELYDGPFGDALAEHVGSATNSKCIGFLSIGGFRQTTNNIRPIVTPDDLKGIKLRVGTSDIRVKLFNEFGASAISMSFSELFTALQQGTVDGQENPLATIAVNKFSEVQKYLSLTNHLYSSYAFFFSDSMWDQYQPELQDLLLEVSKECCDWQHQEAMSQEDALIQQLKDEGMVVNECDLAAFKEASGPIWAYFVEKHGDAGKEFLDLAGVDYSKYL